MLFNKNTLLLTATALLGNYTGAVSAEEYRHGEYYNYAADPKFNAELKTLEKAHPELVPYANAMACYKMHGPLEPIYYKPVLTPGKGVFGKLFGATTFEDLPIYDEGKFSPARRTWEEALRTARTDVKDLGTTPKWYVPKFFRSYPDSGPNAYSADVKEFRFDVWLWKERPQHFVDAVVNFMAGAKAVFREVVENAEGRKDDQGRDATIVNALARVHVLAESRGSGKNAKKNPYGALAAMVDNSAKLMSTSSGTSWWPEQGAMYCALSFLEAAEYNFRFADWSSSLSFKLSNDLYKRAQGEFFGRDAEEMPGKPSTDSADEELRARMMQHAAGSTIPVGVSMPAAGSTIPVGVSIPVGMETKPEPVTLLPAEAESMTLVGVSMPALSG